MRNIIIAAGVDRSTLMRSVLPGSPILTIDPTALWQGRVIRKVQGLFGDSLFRLTPAQFTAATADLVARIIFHEMKEDVDEYRIKGIFIDPSHRDVRMSFVCTALLAYAGHHKEINALPPAPARPSAA